MAGPKNRRKRSSRKSSGSSRRGGKASGKRQSTARRVASRRAAKKARDQQISSRADDNREDYRRNQYKGNADVRTGGINTGREAGIMASQKSNKIKGLEQSVGSLDRRIQNALNKGDTDTAKDLRSRQKNFVKDLGYQRALNTPGGIMQGNVRTSDGRRPLTSAGFDVFQETMDQDFLDPTRKLQNTGGDAYGKMYPIQSKIQKGLPTINAIKSFLGAEDKDIPYNLEDMPGIRYPLDGSFGAGVQEPFGGRSRDPNYRQDFFSAPLEPVTITDMDFDPNPQFSLDDLVLPNMAPFIDKETRNEVFAPDVDNLPANNFAELDKEFQEESKKYFEKKANEPTVADKYPYQVAGPDAFPSYLNLFGQNDTSLEEQALLDALAADTLPDGTSKSIQDELTSTALQGSGYNLQPNIISQLYDQGLLESGTNYFGNNNTTNPLVDQALASYYNN